jgi:hypothetical protein
MVTFDLLALLAQTPEISHSAYSSRDVVAIIAISGPFACAILAIVCHFLGKAGRCLLDTTLKHRMLRLGYTASDIERVLRADTKTPAPPAAKSSTTDIVLAESLKPVTR